jgi:hypothetical protein
MEVRTWMALLAGLAACTAHAQTATGRDGIDRNLQERAMEERALRLDDVPPVPRPIAPHEIRRSVTLPTPGTEILERQPPPQLPPAPRAATPAPPVTTPQVLLDESQRRRQLELQSQLPPNPVPLTAGEDIVRQQATQTQQLQFQREQSATQLGSEIMRNSERAMRR